MIKTKLILIKIKVNPPLSLRDIFPFIRGKLFLLQHSFQFSPPLFLREGAGGELSHSAKTCLIIQFAFTDAPLQSTQADVSLFSGF